MKILLPSITLTCLLCCHSLHALPLRILAWDDSVAARKLVILSSKGTQELDRLHPLQRTPVYQISGTVDAPPVIQALDKVGPDGKPATMAIKIPEGLKNPLLLLLPDDKSPTGLRQFVIEDSVADFKWGSIRLVNASGKAMIFNWEKKLIKVPASWAPMDVSPGGKSHNMEVLLFLEDQPQAPIYSAIWEHREEFRKLVFIVSNPNQSESRVSFKFIVEDRRVIEAEALTAGKNGTSPSGVD